MSLTERDNAAQSSDNPGDQQDSHVRNLSTHWLGRFSIVFDVANTSLYRARFGDDWMAQLAHGDVSL